MLELRARGRQRDIRQSEHGCTDRNADAIAQCAEESDRHCARTPGARRGIRRARGGIVEVQRLLGTRRRRRLRRMPRGRGPGTELSPMFRDARMGDLPLSMRGIALLFGGADARSRTSGSLSRICNVRTKAQQMRTPASERIRVTVHSSLRSALPLPDRAGVLARRRGRSCVQRAVGGLRRGRSMGDQRVVRAGAALESGRGQVRHSARRDPADQLLRQALLPGEPGAGVHAARRRCEHVQPDRHARLRPRVLRPQRPAEHFHPRRLRPAHECATDPAGGQQFR